MGFRSDTLFTKKLWMALLAASLFSPLFVDAQDVASVVGVVQDASGAVVPGTKILLSNPSTGVKLNTTSDSSGAYKFTGVPSGSGYQLTFTHDGFSPYTVIAVYLSVGSSRTQNAKLAAGSDVKVEVSAASQEVTINTEDATVGNNYDVKLLNELPIYDRTSGITTLFNAQPGMISNGSAVGSRTDQNSVTVDGLDVADLGTGSYGAIVGNSPVDAVEEFRGTVAGFGAGSGSGGGGQFQLVTKSGTNKFHGNINEYHRDTDLVANDYFNKPLGIPRPPLIQNQFGGNLGGPILKDKLFFFFNFNGSRIVKNALAKAIVPLDNLRNGNIGYINSNAGCDDSSRADTQPSCITYLTPTQVTALDPQALGYNNQIKNLWTTRYPHATDLTLGDGINTGGVRFNSPTPNNLTGYVGRLDYVINAKMSLFGRGTVTRQNSVREANELPGDPPTSLFVDRSYAFVVGHNWQVSSTKNNQLVYGETKENYAFPVAYSPTGIFDQTFFSGTTQLLTDPYRAPASQSRIIPIQQLSDVFNWQRGRHAIQLGGTTKWIHTHETTANDYNSVYLGLGGQIQSLDSTLRPSDIFNSTTGAAYVDFDEAFTSALGRVANIQGAFNYDASGNPISQGSGSQRQYRYYQTELFASDSWKITPQLNVSFGVDYQLFSVPYEISGKESVPNTTFDKYFAARVAASKAGISGNTAVPFINYELGGKANNAAPLYQPQHNEFAPRFGFAYNPSWNRKTVFNGSAGMVYDRTIVNAIQAEQDNYSYLFEQPFANPFGVAADPRKSLVQDPRLGTTALTSLVNPPPPSTTPYTPFVTNGVPGGLANGGDFNVSIDPSLKTPYSIMTTFGVQHEFPAGMILKVNYVGRYGRRLLAQADANQLVDFIDPASAQGLGTAYGNITLALRAGANPRNLPAQPWFENQLPAGKGVAKGYPNNTSYVANALGSLVVKGDFADSVQALASAGLIKPNVGMGAQFSENTFFTNKGFSTYQGLLASLQKNLSHGLQFTANYTYGHSIDNVSLIANSYAFNGYGFVCDVQRPRLCRGTSDFDVTHVASGTFTYDLPFGRGKAFAAGIPWYVNEAIGGWSISGVTTFQSGSAYSTVSSAFVASYSNDAPAIFNGDKNAIRRNVHTTSSGSLNVFADPAAAVAAFQGPIGFQIGSRNNLRGPKYFDQDLGLAKNFDIYPAKDVRMVFRADAFNAINHASFASPGTLTNYDDITQTSSFGQLTSTAGSANQNTSRVLQVSLRLEF